VQEPCLSAERLHSTQGPRRPRVEVHSNAGCWQSDTWRLQDTDLPKSRGEWENGAHSRQIHNRYLFPNSRPAPRPSCAWDVRYPSSCREVSQVFPFPGRRPDSEKSRSAVGLPSTRSKATAAQGQDQHQHRQSQRFHQPSTQTLTA